MAVQQVPYIWCCLLHCVTDAYSMDLYEKPCGLPPSSYPLSTAAFKKYINKQRNKQIIRTKTKQ